MVIPSSFSEFSRKLEGVREFPPLNSCHPLGLIVLVWGRLGLLPQRFPQLPEDIYLVLEQLVPNNWDRGKISLSSVVIQPRGCFHFLDPERTEARAPSVRND